MPKHGHSPGESPPTDDYRPNRYIPGKTPIINMGYADLNNPGQKHWLHPDVRFAGKDRPAPASREPHQGNPPSNKET